jgi:hypothetical protein
MKMITIRKEKGAIKERKKMIKNKIMLKRKTILSV